jgi:hypothetical protein
LDSAWGEVGDVAEVVASAGGCVYPITTPGGKSKIVFFREVRDMWPYGYWYPWRRGWHRYWWIPHYAWPWMPIPKEDEIAMLEEQARIFERELENIKKRLEELKKEEVKNA